MKKYVKASGEFTSNPSITCFDIKWDTDGVDAAELGLPESVIIDNPSDEMIADLEEYNDAIMDYLSDEFGYTIISFRAELNGARQTYDVNIKTFLDKFRKEYNFLYDNYDRVAGYYEAVDEFDARMASSENFKKFVREFCNYRGDFISSDREAAAFMFTMESMGLLN